MGKVHPMGKLALGWLGKMRGGNMPRRVRKVETSFGSG